MAVLDITLFSHALMRTVPLTVILPADKHDPGSYPTAYQTLYLLHGVYGDRHDWTANTPVQRWAEERDLAVVMPSGDNMFYVDQAAPHNLYGTFIGEELVELTRAMFPLSRQREDTFIGGLSMGGYGALRNGLLHPETFGAICAFSSVDAVECAQSATDENARFPFLAKPFLTAALGDLSAIPGSDRDVIALAQQAQAVGKPLPRLFMSCGESDTLCLSNRNNAESLRNLGFDITYEEGPGSHEWEFWTKSLAHALAWLPLADASASVSSGNVGL